MKLITVLAMLAFCCAVTAQTAKVVQLSTEDAAQAKALAEEQKALDEKIVAFRESIEQKYLVTTEEKERGSCYAGQVALSDPVTITDGSTTGQLFITGPVTSTGSSTTEPRSSLSHTPYYRQGWGCGEYQYSDDFRFIVPLPEPNYKPSGLCGFYTTN